MTHWEPPSRVVVRGESDTVEAEDGIVFSESGQPAHTSVEYTADIKLKGFLSLFTFLVAGDIRALGVQAKEGLEKAFAEGRHKE